jgi:hypothetical protein
MSFDFDKMVRKYRKWATPEKGGDYPRYFGWDQLWTHVQEVGGLPGMVAEENLERSSLQLAFFLAVWGMFRGSGRLGSQNLEFYKDLLVHLHTETSPEFWSLDLRDFDRADRAEYRRAKKLLKEANRALVCFQAGGVTWTDTLKTKVLLGLWGQVPALDRFVLTGFYYFNKEFEGAISPYRRLSPRLMASLAEAARDHAWPLDHQLSPDGGIEYPPGKVIDMAFWQYGYKIQNG